MPILLLAEHNETKLSEVTARVLTAARAIGHDVDVLVAGGSARSVADTAAKLPVRKVLYCEGTHLEHARPEALAELITHLAPAYTHVFSAATSIGKDVMPRVAALLDVMQISEIVKVVAPDVFERPIYAGNAIQKIRSTDPIKVVTVRTSAFPPTDPSDLSCEIQDVLAPSDRGLSTVEDVVSRMTERPELAGSRVVVSGGRALSSKDDFERIILPLADALCAAVGASRAAVDAGFASNDSQVGQTGKVVAPELYVAVGISGAIQHLAGMKDSKFIVAINKDPDAPIFQVADFGLVGDLFELAPEMPNKLTERSSS